MTNIAEPYSKEEILLALERTQHDVAGHFSAMEERVFFARTSDAWSPAENLEHLVKSVEPVAQALQIPKVALQLLFGRASAPSRPYTDVRDDYLARLARGVEASGRYIPTENAPSTAPMITQTEWLLRWERAGSRLHKRLAMWREDDLDRCRLPHPILGKLTVREMLFFTIYHECHHLAGKRE